MKTVTIRLDRVVHGTAYGSARRRRALRDGDSPVKPANDGFSCTILRIPRDALLYPLTTA